MKRVLKKKVILFSSLFLCILIIIGVVINNNRKITISSILKTEYYSYLPIEAKEYITKVYEETGEIILTEENKEVNKPYLNPQYVEYLGLSEEEKALEGFIPHPIIIDYNNTNDVSDETYPEKYDLRNVDGKNFITPIRDQGDLGLCWSFASTSVLETHLLKKSNTSYNKSSQLISERQIDYATSKNGIKDYQSEYQAFIDRELGDGGNFYVSTVALASGISAVDYNWKEYDDNDLSQMELYDVLNYNNSLYEVNETINVPLLTVRHSDESEENQNILNNYINTIKENIMKYGAAHVGTYYNNKCNYIDSSANNTIIDIYGCSRSGGHAMTIIGWDDNVEYDYCADTLIHKDDISNCRNIVSGKGVWILKNSWGEDSDPYPYLAYDSLDTSVHFITDVTTKEEKDWDNNYVLGTEVTHFSTKEYLLSDSRIKDNEKLNKIKFISGTEDTTYGITIVDANGETSRSTKYVENPGLVTIEYDPEIIINKDSKITISTIESTNGEFIDKLLIFTSNIDNKPYVSLEKIENKEFQYLSNRVYLDTKNIPPGTIITYKLYDENNNDVSANISYENNKVAENNINLSLTFNRELNVGNYRLDAIYNSNVIASTNIKFKKMEGSGTENDPYVIKTSEHLDQIREDLDAHYILGNDIDLTEDTREGGKFYNEAEFGGGHGWIAITQFTGTLDGKGHTIKGLFQRTHVKDETGYSYITPGGLFGTATGNITIKNLILENFDIECGGTNGHPYCAPLLSRYYTETAAMGYEEQHVVFENIAVKNSKVVSKRQQREIYLGGVFGSVGSSYNENNTLKIKNIYSDSLLYGDEISGLFEYCDFENTDISNIQLNGEVIGKYSYILGRNLGGNINFNNIFSSFIDDSIISVKGSVPNDSVINFSNINLLKINDNFYTNISRYIENLNAFEPGVNSIGLTNKNNYSTWEDFDENWVMETVDGIPRYPVLKFVDFEYTKIDDIVINQELNKKYSIYDYIYPKTESAKRISFKSKDESIVKIDENGTIIPQSTGSTTIHIESYYDGYIKDVPITITYVPHYTIHFDANDTEDYYKDIEGTMESIEVEAGQSFTLPANKFTQEYYEFKEWNTASDGTGISYSDLSEIPAMNDKEEITLYVQWWGKERIVTFDANGGTVNPDKKVVRVRTNYGELPIPMRAGYGFSNWYGGAIYIDAFSQLSELELIARWEEDAYTIIYDANGGTIQEDKKHTSSVYLVSDALATDYSKNGKDKEVYKNIYEKPGYVFKEWNTMPDGTGTSYAVEQIINLSNVKNDTLRLYAQWEKVVTYNIDFNSNGGEGEMPPQTFNTYEEKEINANTFTKDGYTFAGWNTLSDGTGTSYQDKEKVMNLTNVADATIILYAQWVPIKYNVEFNANDGSGTMGKQIFVYDEAKKLNANMFTREGYLFKEWNTVSDGTGTSYKENEDVKNLTSLADATIILYAQWQPITYNIEFNSNGGTGTMNKQVFIYDVPQKLNANTFTRDGYYFSGWSTEPDGTGAWYLDQSEVFNLTNTNNEFITLYANWDKSPTISYISSDYEDIYDGSEHSIDIYYVSVQDYNIKYSINNTDYNLTELPKFKDVGEYTVYYKITADGYEDITGSNKVKIYGVKSFDPELTFKDDVIVIKNNSFKSITDKIKTYSLSTEYLHMDKYSGVIGDEIVGTGHKLRININYVNHKEYIISVIGDISGDGLINSADLLKMRQHLIGTKSVFGEYHVAADITNDNAVNSADLLRLRQHLIGTKPIA